MNKSIDNPLSDKQLTVLEAAFHDGSSVASAALAKWIGRPSVVEIDSIKQFRLAEATGVLATGEDPLCFCTMHMEGPLCGEVVLAFDDTSGLALADMLLEQPSGTATHWEELEISAALETANILCSAYLNSLSRSFVSVVGDASLLPTPPQFRRDFAESLVESALMGQAVASDLVIFALTRFEIDEVRVNWTLLFVPDAESMSQLRTVLVGDLDH